MRRYLILIFLTGLFCHQSIAATPAEKNDKTAVDNKTENNKIILATGEWEPYISSTKAGHGKFAEIVTNVFNTMGIKTELVFSSWTDVETKVKKAEVFAGIPYSYTKERSEAYDYSIPIMKSDNVFFYNKKAHPDGITYTHIEELTKYRITGVKGYWYVNLFSKAKLNVDYVESEGQSFTKLYANQTDFVASDKLVGWELIKKMYPNEVSQFDIVPRPFETTTLHLLVSRDYPNAMELTQKFNAAFKKLNADDEQ